MVDNNQGFAAVVSAIERLRDTAYNNTGLRVAVSRGRLLEERKQTEEIKKLANENRQLRDRQGRFAKEQNGLFKNLMSGRGVTGKGYTPDEAKQAALAAQKGTTSGKFKRMSDAEAKTAALQIAKSTNQGFQQGLNQGDAGGSFGESFLKSFKDSLGINSPSKKAEKLAGYFVQGWEIGLKSLSISTDAALDEQGKRFRKQLRKTIVESRGQSRDSQGRYTKAKPDPATNETYWADTSHAVVNAQQNALQSLYVRDAGPAVQDTVKAIFGDEAKEEAEIRQEIRRRKKSLIKQIQKESELSAEEQKRLEESRLSRKVLSPKQRLAYLQTVEKRPELIKEYGEVSAMYPNKRNVEELAALRYYTKPAGYKEMNMPLRGLTKEYQGQLKDQGINRTQKRITKESTLNTDLAIGALNKMPGYEGTTYRGLTLSDDDIEAIQTGGTYKEKGFFSTTKNKQQRYPGNVVFEIKSNKRGKDVSEIEAYANNEVLFAPNSEFNVANKRKVERLGQTFWVIELEDKNPAGADFVGGIPKIDVTKPTQPQAKKVKPKTTKRAIAGEESRGGNVTEINTRAVFITADTVTIEQSGKEPDPGQETEKITDELQKLREDIKTNGFKSAIGSLFKSVATGLAIAFAQSMKDDFFAGFKGGVKERSGFDFTDAGAGVGRFVGNPLASAKETVKARKVAKLDDSLAEAEQMARREDVQIQDGKVKVYTAGGLGGPGVEDFANSLRSIGIDPENADIESTFNPNSSTDIPLSDPLRFAGDALLNKYVKNEFVNAQNRDAVKLAAKVIAARKKDPNAKINLVGHSGGADIVQQAIAILEKGGYAENVQGIGVGGIDIGTGYDTENYRNIAGNDDYVVKATSPLGSQPTARDFGQVSKLGSHKVAEYFKHPDFIKGLDQSLQPNAVATILDQYYENLIQEYGDDALPLLEEFLRDGQKFAEEFNQQFGEEETARINEILQRYNAKRVEIAGDGVRHGGIKAKPKTAPTVGQTIRTEADRLTVQLVSALQVLTNAVGDLTDRLLNRQAVQMAAPWTGEDPWQDAPPRYAPPMAEPWAGDDPWAEPEPRVQQPRPMVSNRPRVIPVTEDTPPPRQIPIDWQEPPPAETDAQRKTRQARERLAQAEQREADRRKKQKALADEIFRQDFEIQALKEQYIIYLRFLVERAKRQAPDQIRERFPDYDRQTPIQKAVLADTEIRDISGQMAAFRDMSSQGDYTGMQAEAERLIPLIEQARRIDQDAGRMGTLAENRNRDLNTLRSELLQGSSDPTKAQVGVISALNLNTKAIAELIKNVKALTQAYAADFPTRMEAGGADTYAMQMGIDVPQRRSPVPDVPLEGGDIQTRFADYLQVFIADAKAAAESQVELLMSGFRGLSTQGKKEFAKSFSDQIKSKAAEYRAAIANGQRELSNSLGLSLIRQVASTRKIYDTILSDPSSQNMGRKSIQGMKGYLSQVENEVISGQPNMQGRSPDGLIQNLDKAIEAAAAGDDTAQGFINALDSAIGEFFRGGENAGNATLDGLDDSLDMHSPSEEMRKRGKNAGDSFGMGAVESLRAAGNAISAEINKLKAAIDKDLEYLRAVATGDTAKAQAMVGDAAKGAGYNETGSHGLATGKLVDNSFDSDRLGLNTKAKSAQKGFFFASRATAQSYAAQSGEETELMKQLPDRLMSVINPLMSVPDGKSPIIDRFKKMGSFGIKPPIDNTGIAYAKSIESSLKGILYDVDRVSPSDLPKTINEDKQKIQELIDFLGTLKERDLTKDPIIDVFLKLQKPKIHDQEGKGYRDKSYADVLTSARRGKRDGAIIKNTYDGGPLDDVKVVFNPNQIKSADAVTKTNEGKPVPLSARFDDSVADIRGNVNDIFAGLKSQAGEALQPLIAELETQFAAMGDNSINSLINSLEGLMGQLRGTGGDVGDELAEGTEDALKIKSPSKVFAAIGESIIAGLEQGLTGFEGTLEEKRQLLETYVKSVIELIYDFKKVTGEAETPAQEVRKLFQEIGKTGNATPEQLQQAKGYFPRLSVQNNRGNGAAYSQTENLIYSGQNPGVNHFAHEYTHGLQNSFTPLGRGEIPLESLTEFQPSLSLTGKKFLQTQKGKNMVAHGAESSATRAQGALTGIQDWIKDLIYQSDYKSETEAYANGWGIEQNFNKRKGLIEALSKPFFKADAQNVAPQIKKRKTIESMTSGVDGVFENDDWGLLLLRSELEGIYDQTNGFKVKPEKIKTDLLNTSNLNALLGDEKAEEKRLKALSMMPDKAKAKLASIGINITDSLTQSIEGDLGDVKDSGMATGDAFAEGLEESLEIDSPSKRMEAIAEWAMKGFARGVNESGDLIRDQLSVVLDKMEQVPFLGWFVKVGRKAVQFFENLMGRPKRGYKDEWMDLFNDLHLEQETVEVKVKPDIQEPDTTKTQTQAIAGETDQKQLPGGHIGQKLLGAIADAKETVQEQVLTLQESYAVYLKNLMDRAGEAIADAGLDKGQLTSQVEQFRERIKADLGHFRQAVTEGSNILALQVGEGILAKTAAVKEMFGAMGKDATGTEKRSLAGKKGAATKQQKEVIKGGTTKNASPKGLWEIVGDDTTEGFIQALRAKIDAARQAGVDFSLAAYEGAKEALKIESPSKMFEQLGNWVVEGFNKGMRRFGDDAENNIVEFTRNSQDEVTDLVTQLREKLSELPKLLQELPQSVLSLAGAVGSAIAVFVGLKVGFDMLNGLAQATFETIVAFEGLNLAFIALSGGSSAAQKNMKFVSDTAKRLGIDLQTAEQAYLGLMATTRGTALEGTQTEQIFDAFAQTASVRGLSNDEQGRMFAAIQQMLGKQKVSAEEVRGQLGEIGALDFQGTLSRSLGISVAQLDEVMSSGQLMAADVLPKIAAQYAAENAIVANSSETTGQAIARYNNSIEELKRQFVVFGQVFRPIYNFFAEAINWFSFAVPAIINIVLKLATGLAAQLLPAMFKSAIVGKALGLVWWGLSSAIIALGKALIANLGPFLLFSLAIDALWAAFKVWRDDPFEEFTKSLDTAKKSTIEMEKALAKLNKTASETKPPVTGRIVSEESWSPFGISVKPLAEKIGVDTEDGMGQNIGKVARFGPLALLGKNANLETIRQGVGLRTLGEKQFDDFLIKGGDSVTNAYRTLEAQIGAEKLVEDVKKIDAEINRVRTRRANLIAGDTEQYGKIVKEEQELLKERERIFTGTSSYATALEKDITNLKQGLEDLANIKAPESQKDSLRLSMETALADLEKTKQSYDDLSNSLQKSLSYLERQLRNLNEQYAAFNENLNRQSTNNRVQFLRQASESGTGSTIRDMGLSALDSQATQDRIAFLRKQIEEINGYLSEPKFAQLLQELADQASLEGTDLNNSATLDRLINEMSPDSGERKAVATNLKRMLELQDELGQAEEGLTQSLMDQRSALFDLNRTIADFFQQLTQQFEEARIELDRVKNQLKYGGLKQKLQKALVPGSNSFINGVIGSIQGIFDQASSVMESVLGQRSSRLSFAGEKYSLDNQMTDFARSVNGATQAVEAFRASLAGGQATLNNAGQSGAVATNRGGGVIGALNRPNTIQKTFNQNDFKQASGFVFPVPGGKITGDQGDGHRGLDVFAPVGTPILASLPGTIVQAMKGGTVNTEDSNPGKPGYQAQHSVKVKLDTPIQFNGKTINYYWNTHLTSMAPGIQVGARVNAGDKLGEVGMAGGAPHLHQAFSPVESFRGNTPLSNKESLALYTAIKQSGGATPQTQLASNANTGGGIFNNPIVKKIYDAAVAKGVDPWLMIAKAARETGGDDPMAIKHTNPKTGKVISSNPSPGRFDVGVGQVSPAVAKDLGYSDKDRFDLDKNIDMMIGYFIQQMNAVGGDARKALAAYNAGLAGMRRGGGFGYADTIMQNRSRIAQSSPVATNVSYSQPQQQQAIVATAPDPAIARGEGLKNRILDVNGSILDVNGQLVKQQIDNLLLAINQEKQSINRQLVDGTRMAENTIADSQSAFADLLQQYSPQTLSSQTAAEVRQANNTLRQQFNELFERRRDQEDVLKGAKDTVAGAPAAIAELENRANDVAPEQAIVDRAKIDLIKSIVPVLERDVIPAYEKALAATAEQEQKLNDLKTAMDAWLVTQAKQRKLDQDGEMIALRLSVAQASYNEQLKLQKDLETADNEYEKRKLLEEQRLINQPELLKEVLALLEKERDAKKKNLQYDFDALIRGRELEAVGRQLGLAQSEFNSEKILSLEIAQAELEAENNRLKILREVTDEAEKARQLELTDAEKLQKIRQSELDNINRILDRKQGDRDLDSRQAENAANLSRNPFAATQLRENNAIANRQLEFERRAEEIRQTQPADRAAAMIAQESEILAQDLELIDREFRDLSETIGDNLGNAFNSFTDALISGDNALQAFTNALLKSVSDIGSQLMQQGMNGLMQNIFGKSGAIGGLFGGGGNPVASVGSILPGMITPFMGPKLFADGGYTGDGGKYEAKGIVHGGEFVINKAATRKIGLPALMTANALGQLPGYATGGYVGSVESRLLSGLNSTRMPSISLPTENRRSPVAAGPVSNTVNVNINDRESRFFKQSRTLAREIADELRA